MKQFYKELKLIKCPHCKLIGFLILHGYLYGYDEKIYNKKINRGKRFFCSNRNKRKGCGKTFSLLKLTIIRGFIITANSIWEYLNNLAKNMNKKDAFNKIQIIHSDSTIYRLLNRFKLNQHNIRTLLTRISKPPEVINTTNPIIQTVTHLKEAFKEYNCPVAAFQYRFQTSFL